MVDDGREMIPLKLTLSNFLCYRDDLPPLDLEGIHIACLCGDNGHGKSALLDAITFALWGSSRLGERNHDDLIHKGQRNMYVDLEFESAGDRYRVVRRRTSRRSQGVTDLQLFIQNESGGWLAVTGNTVRDTQELITERIRLDHETFVNTAFLRQGDADHFTTSSPSDRKRILAEVLDLSYYDRLEGMARERSSDLRARAQRLESEIEVREREAARRPGLESDLVKVSGRIGAIGSQLSAARSELEESSRAVAKLEGKKMEIDGLTPRLAELGVQAREAGERAAQYGKKVRTTEALIVREPEIEDGYKRLLSAQREEGRLTQALVSKSRLDGLLAEQERVIAVEGQRLAARREQLEATEKELSAKSNGAPALERALAEQEPERERLASMERRIEDRRTEMQAMESKAAALNSENERHRQTTKDTRQKFDLLDAGEAECPLCGQGLEADGREHLRAEYEALGRTAAAAYRANTGELNDLERRGRGLRSETQRLESDFRRKQQEIHSRESNLQRDLKEAEDAGARLGPVLDKLAEVSARIESGDFAREARGEVESLRGEIAGLGYDGAAHKAAQVSVRELGPFGEQRQQLEAVKGQIEWDRAQLGQAESDSERLRGELEEMESRRKRLAAEVEGLPEAEARRAGHDRRREVLDGSLSSARVEKGVIEEAISRCERLAGEVVNLKRQRASCLREESLYQELALAFGRNGIQALIIEDAIPQLDSDANELLGRLTDNRMSLRLELTEGRRVRGTGASSEEMRINIADEMGTRAYETFSGGEAFRINFALRIALSRLLARRSGAPLPVLFIDEGFGSQDASGQQRLVEAIQSIRSDFDKIIVITHIESIKEAFDTRIQVEKTEMGSRYEVVWG